MNVQAENLERVRRRIAHLIIEFARLRGEQPFHADDLRNCVISEVAVAPASADRILRYLRRSGTLDYVVLNRRQSLYRFIEPKLVPPALKPKRRPRKPVSDQMSLFLEWP